MSADALARLERRDPLEEIYQRWGCRANALDVRELFRRYQAAGFLHPAKARKLAPYRERVIDNWERALTLGDRLVLFLVYEKGGAWGTVTSWLHATRSWTSQHLIAVGGPVASGAVNLALAEALEVRRGQGVDDAQQHWFHPDDRSASRVFKMLNHTAGSELCVVNPLAWFEVLRVSSISSGSGRFAIQEVTRPRDDLLRLACSARGLPYVHAERLDDADLLLAGVDALYARAGLRRFRRIWVAVDDASGKAVAAAVAYRGPLGLNFSFLENRIDLLIEPGLPEADVERTVAGLLARASEIYDDFEPDRLYVAAGPEEECAIAALGGRKLRDFTQSVWLGPAYRGCHEHYRRAYASDYPLDRVQAVPGSR